MSFLKRLMICLAFAAFYFSSAKLGLNLAFLQANATPVWPPSGLAIAFLILLGTRFWPGVFIGAFFANFLTQGNIATSLAIAGGNTVEAAFGAALILRYANGRATLERPATVLIFVMAILLGASISAGVGVTALSMGGYAAWENYSPIWLTWWLGNITSGLIVTPFFLAWAQRPWPFRLGRLPEGLFLTLATLFVGLIVFNLGLNAGRFPLQFLILPLIVWAGFRFGQPGTTLFALCVSTLAIYGTWRGFGPFVEFGPNSSLLLLQAYMGTVALTGLFLSAVLRQKQDMEGILAVSNRELEQFAYACSHDLKEPLRKISAYTDVVARTLEPRLTDDEKHRMGFVISSVARMETLIDDLLAYARLGQERAKREDVDLNKIVKQVFGDIETAVRESHAIVTTAELPIVHAHPSQLRRLFQNLFLNGIKFRGAEPPRVHVSGERRGADILIAVRDNGIGIERQYAGKIFEVFQRLNPATTYPGSGIGLAICKRIVESHGGTIWVDSTPGEGSTFYFTLPV
jgi:signal transduction histidine kinase